MDTYTQDQLEAAVRKAVAEATAERDSRIAELEHAAEASAQQEQIEAIEAAADQKVAEAQAALEAAEVRATAAEQALSDTRTYLEAEAEAAANAAAIEELADARVAEAREIGLSEEFCAQMRDAWAQRPDEVWEASKAEWQAAFAAAGGAPEPGTEGAPASLAQQFRTPKPTGYGSIISGVMTADPKVVERMIVAA